MSTSPSAVPAATCNYCGAPNPDRLVFCSGCGNRLVDELETPEEIEQPAKPKSRILAVCLTLIFGPLGLIYVNAWGTMLLMIALAIPFLLTHAGGLWVTFGSRVLCSVLAYTMVTERSEAPNERRDAARFLNAAARLESVDREKAIAAYRDIVRLYPNTTASREAAQNIEILIRHD